MRPFGLSGFCFGSEGLYGLAGVGDHHEVIYIHFQHSYFGDFGVFVIPFLTFLLNEMVVEEEDASSVIRLAYYSVRFRQGTFASSPPP